VGRRAPLRRRAKDPASVSAPLDRIVERLERVEWLDRVSEALVAGLGKVLPAGPVEDVLSGTPLAHPAHPMLVAVPIGAWTSASVFDVTGDTQAADRLVGLGVLAAVPAALTGLSDWLTTSGPERRVGLVHAASNYGALALQVSSLAARRKKRHVRGAALSAAALTLTGVAGWLGGHLAYALGVGVDTTAFQHFPTEWTDVCSASDVHDEPSEHTVAGVPLVVYQVDGRVVALADRCTHRGGPLHEGEVGPDGCITCPWHGSRFDSSGRVRSGPATRPQPALEVRTRGGRLQVRRDEQRTLRVNPVGR
jgi:nitrite reductase/ring-hydroxylating ferredoxin subunit/uncharacterized membrane protein